LSYNEIKQVRKTLLVVTAIFVLFALFVGWFILGPLQIDYTDTRVVHGFLHVSSQRIPIIINGTITVTSIALSGSLAFIGLTSKELLTDEKNKFIKNNVMWGHLKFFPLFLLLLFFPFFIQLMGDAYIEIALLFAFEVVIFATLYVSILFVLIEPVLHEKTNKKIARKQTLHQPHD
jgi:hypothetical protein